ncbi:MAG: hypothetical protein Aurels2KO_54800 [Aureliella sp.]
MPQSTETGKKPIYRKSLPHGIGTAVFENEYDGRTFRSITLQRSYKKDDEWKRSSMFLDHDHIPFVIEALNATWDFLNSSSSSTTGTDA